MQNYFYNCSRDYIDSVHKGLFEELTEIINRLPKRQVQSEVNCDIFWLLTSNGWTYDTLPKDLGEVPGFNLDSFRNLNEIRNAKRRNLCKTSTNLKADWHCDFASDSTNGIIQLEVQFGKVEAMFKDFCGFKIAHKERRLALGIEIVMHQPSTYFEHRKKSISGMAYFDIAREVLPVIELTCPIWLIGIE